eukprot:SM000138S00072  [mRNA]  locus=s138:331360:332864:- [translate_table: standard]
MGKGRPLEFAQMATSVRSLGTPEGSQPRETVVSTIPAGFACNAYTICDGELKPPGLHPVVSIGASVGDEEDERSKGFRCGEKECSGKQTPVIVAALSTGGADHVQMNWPFRRPGPGLCLVERVCGRHSAAAWWSSAKQAVCTERIPLKGDD